MTQPTRGGNSCYLRHEELAGPSPAALCVSVVWRTVNVRSSDAAACAVLLNARCGMVDGPRTTRNERLPRTAIVQYNTTRTLFCTEGGVGEGTWKCLLLWRYCARNGTVDTQENVVPAVCAGSCSAFSTGRETALHCAASRGLLAEASDEIFWYVLSVAGRPSSRVVAVTYFFQTWSRVFRKNV